MSRLHSHRKARDVNEFADWVGRSQTMIDVLEPARSNALDAAFGGTGAHIVGDTLPLLHHWLYFWDVKQPSALGEDGHPAKGGFLPPVPLPRRMWAGGRLRFHRPLRLGMTVSKTSTIMAIEEKTGRSGRLIFVTMRHELDDGDGVAISEQQDLVYREAAVGLPAAAAVSPPPAAPWIETINPNPVLLFRYSALTMNGHRIHYDRPYAIEQEHYSSLVIHGPLQATLLMRLAMGKLDQPITSFDFRGEAPAYEGAPLHLCGAPTDEGATIWTQQGDAKNMVATICWD
jgi:3-methylfumaryl-CoA hydratase